MVHITCIYSDQIFYMISAGKGSNIDVIYLRLLSNSWIKTVGTDKM